MNSIGMSSSITQQGFWLFRWRSYLPLIVIPFVAIAILEGEQIRSTFGALAGSVWNWGAVGCALLGLGLRSAIVGFVPMGTSGRNTRALVANSLNQTGAYSLCRHPIYVANFVIFTGILMLAQSLWLTIASSLAYWMYYERIICAEEEFLIAKFGEHFKKWAEVTPTVMPNFRNWKKPSLNFSFRTVLLREYSTTFLIVSAMTLLTFVKLTVAGIPPLAHPLYLLFFAINAVIYLIFRYMKKHTRWLFVDGRS